MNIKIEKININDDTQIKAMTKWGNDKKLHHLVIPVKDKNLLELETVESMKEKYQKNPEFAMGLYLVFDDSKPIGNFSLQMDPDHLMKKIQGTSWLGLTIGEKEYWGTGVAQIAMKYFEDESKRLGAKRIELGTFEFNLRAQAFYKKLGYVEIGRIPDFTYWEDKYWDDIRMEKNL